MKIEVKDADDAFRRALVKKLIAEGGETHAAAFLTKALMELGTLPADVLDHETANAGSAAADPGLYGNFWRDARETLAAWRADAPTIKGAEPPLMVDFGGGAGEHAGFREGFRYVVIDVAPVAKDVETITHDLNTPMPFDDGAVDVVFSNQVLEHLSDPWTAVRDIGRVLKPGGLCLASTVFSYRYHPYPEDYWRFTHAGLRHLFETEAGLTTDVCKFELTHRRDDRRGALGHRDAVHVDWLGGFRENWFVYFVGRKPAK